MANEEKKPVSGQYLEYLGKPLVREGDTICYGDMNEKCILIMEILSYKDKDNKHLPDKIMIQIIDSKNPNRIIRQGSYNGLHDAFGMGLIWLDQALQQS
ncbi:MAG: hypothetical protein IJW40_10335 [Clostridia bacterium]|nr:hypothetical protein [Clostridia bacterium]